MMRLFERSRQALKVLSSVKQRARAFVAGEVAHINARAHTHTRAHVRGLVASNNTSERACS
jgi:hypothetical protein